VEDGLLGLRGDGTLGLLCELEDGDELEEEGLEERSWQCVCGHLRAVVAVCSQSVLGDEYFL
jgi:hypothetical protein